MFGTGLNFGRGRGEGRFNNTANSRQNFKSVNNDMLRRAHSDVTENRSSVTEKPTDSVNRVEPENRTGSEEEEEEKTVAVSTLKQLSNLEQFLLAIQPHVTVHSHSKRTMRALRPCDVELQPYFVLSDLWESFREWSAYGAGVPLVLNDNDGVVQYYAPFLSGIQIYAQTVKPSGKSSDFRDSSSDGSSDCEPERSVKYLREQRNIPPRLDEIPRRMGRLSLRDHHVPPQDGFSSDDGDSVNHRGYLLFEYFEQDRPYMREPLVDKILDLALGFPELMTLRSCDMLPSSWISVAWYPIYRIPTGPTLKDLDACFLTYHSLHTPVAGSQKVQAPVARHATETKASVYKMSLPVFGLASYKFRGPLWTPNSGYEHQLASSLFQAADNWLRLLNVHHPDFVFFSRR
ncbi:PREDICTED: uncharacterized protein LOC109336596 isoform X2 [Lupinus angustifolius]|uniref:uncharacterized protein LOC109336596 isoform X2 n=1 Tax=Lupinus angustifolius TaxID=3871 RepID=UPI00092E6F0C|nr:PREDICTED: uncharacterized protein LOC109336596 isoform X2 [Lupinus angustifolius]